MNPSDPPPPVPPRLSNSANTKCPRHPDDPVTGFCAACLCERLETFNPNAPRLQKSNNAKPSSSSIKSFLFSNNNNSSVRPISKNQPNDASTASSSYSAAASNLLPPQLRRTKSFSATRANPPLPSSSFEPQRKSCDVRVRNTLWSLFYLDDEIKPIKEVHGEIEVEIDGPDEIKPIKEVYGEIEVEIDGPNALNQFQIASETFDNGGGRGCEPEIRVSDEPEIMVSDEPEIRVSDEPEVTVCDQPEIRVSEEPEMGAPNPKLWAQDSKFRVSEHEIRARDPDIKICEQGIKVRDHEIRPREHDMRARDHEIRAREHELRLRVPEEVLPIVEESEPELKTMKAHIDLDSQSRGSGRKNLPEKRGEHHGSFWLASLFSRKLQKWRRKGRGSKKAAEAEEKRPNARQFRDTQSEIMDGPRFSCDTGPRFSLDLGRPSWDEPRYSWDEPRASWDGYLTGKLFFRPPMSSEDPPINRSDKHLTVEPVRLATEDPAIPGGSAQTRDYYSDSSSQRRRRNNLSEKSDSSSSRKFKLEDTSKHCSIDTKNNNTTKVSPATLDDLSSKFAATESNFGDHSLRDDYSESFGSSYREMRGPKKLQRWSKAWNRTIAGSIWGLIHRRSSKEEERESRGERECRGNFMDHSFSESWQERESNGVGDRVLRMKELRSNSSVSSRSSYGNGWTGRRGSLGNLQREGSARYQKKRDEIVIERNRSARYSPGHHNIDNGLLRFYLTPMRSSRRSGHSGNNRLKDSNSFARTVLRLY
ncbi:hypothetical protein AMTRI_Chr08g202340 [Amborella trichopoda]|uniref:Uncharacterized protein n=1 Tax=Amborella trichopoda TaxID=13333 RepID=W1PNQ9_AMBTC|nr:UPF0503 protein At3g09070, chloroplastic [Amborella trichopoda]ERN09683.1 hypothetical protein AMTR_s00029p00213140 [Amborella trichopoda]|eukprot:XP_006848102.1 UPF0503 protein At3g09070, chloroplastic [Amborella trichopoda]